MSQSAIDLRSLRNGLRFTLQNIVPSKQEGSATIHWTEGLKMKQKITGGSVQEFSDTEAGGVTAPAKRDSVSRLEDMRPGSKNNSMRSEAYITLGRLSHVKMRHKSDAEGMLVALEERVAGPFDSAVRRVRGEYEALKHNLDTLYVKSIQDLDAQKLALEKPTRARIELLEGQKTTAEQAEIQLTSILANPDESLVCRELVNISSHVNKVLKSSLKLMGMQFPEEDLVTARDFPVGRLHNVVIAPKRSGDRRSAYRSSSVNRSKSGLGSEEIQAEAASGGTGTGRGTRATEKGCCRKNHATRSAPGWKDRGPPEEGVVEEETGTASKEKGQGTEKDQKKQQACGHCACACQADDVWQAYGALRKRYHALKEQADEEEIRMKIDEFRRGLQEEFNRKRESLEAEFDQKRKEMESKHGLSQAEMENLRNLVQASITESQAIQKESVKLREKVAAGEKQLEKARRESKDAKEEVEKRKQHTHMLLCRIRELKRQTAAFVGSSSANGGIGGAGVVSPTSSDSDDLSSDIDSNSDSSSYATDDIASVSRSGDINRSRYTESTTRSTSAAVPTGCSARDASSEIDEDHTSSEAGAGDSELDDDDDYAVPAVRGGRPGQEEGSYRERELKREHEHLARQVKDLTAKLSAARVRVDDFSSSADSNLSSEESAAYTSSTTYTTSEQTGTTKTTREEASSSHDTSGEQSHRNCGYHAFAAAEADDCAARQHERERLASRREWRTIRDSRIRQMRGGNISSPASSRVSSSNGQSESDTWQDYVGRVDDADERQRSKSSSAGGRSWFGRRGSSHSQSRMNNTTTTTTSSNGGAGREKAGFWQGKEIEEVY